MCSLMLIRRKNGSGKSIPAIGIHVMPKQMRRYANWKSVNNMMYLNGTDSTNEAWNSSRTLPRKNSSYDMVFADVHLFQNRVCI